MPKISFFSLAPKLDRYFKSSLEQFGFSFYFIKEYFPNETIDSRRKETSRARIVRLSLKIFKTHDTKKKKKKNLSKRAQIIVGRANVEKPRTAIFPRNETSLHSITRLLLCPLGRGYEGSAISCNSRWCSRGQLRRNVTAQYYSTKLARCIRTMGPNYVRYRLH